MLTGQNKHRQHEETLAVKVALEERHRVVVIIIIHYIWIPSCTSNEWYVLCLECSFKYFLFIFNSITFFFIWPNLLLITVYEGCLPETDNVHGILQACLKIYIYIFRRQPSEAFLAILFGLPLQRDWTYFCQKAFPSVDGS